MKRLASLFLILTMILSLGACGGTPAVTPETPESPAVSETPEVPEAPAESEPEVPAEPEKPEVNCLATVSTGDTVVEADTLEAILAAIDPSGKSVVTLYKDLTTNATIELPASCTLDLGGCTIQTNRQKDNGINVLEVGTENNVTTIKNGTLSCFESGIRVNHGGVIVENMTIRCTSGAPVCVFDNTPGLTNLITGSTLSSGKYGCFSYNSKDKDFTAASVTVENSTLISYKNENGGTSAAFVRNTGATPGTVVFGEHVEIYSYADNYAYKDYTSLTGKLPVRLAKLATMKIGARTCSDLQHWSTSPVPGTEAVTQEASAVAVPAGPVTPTTVPSEFTDYLAGFGRTDITPTHSMPLAGYGFTSSRMSSGIGSSLYATAVAITGKNGQSVILLGLDLINDRGSIASDIRAGISQSVGIDFQNVIVTYSHTHSAPDLDNTDATDRMKDYTKAVIRQAIIAGEMAWYDRKPAEMQVGSVDVPGYNFIRHYLRQDGTYSGSGFGSTATPIVSHAGEVDEEMRLIQFVRKDAENVVLMNWQAHGVLISHRQNGTEEYQQISSDYIGGIRDYVEKKTGCKLAYFQGAAGNIDPDSYITHENPTRNPELYGKNVGDFAVQCLKDNMKKIEAGPVLTHAFTFDGRVNHADEHLLDAAYALKASGSTNLADAQKLGLISRHHATTIIRCTGLGETLPVPCSVLSVGNIGFACAPFELFSATGVAIREESPFDTTFILGYCNNSQGYLPTEFGFDINSYEEACTNFARGVAEELVAAYAAKWAELKP